MPIPNAGASVLKFPGPRPIITDGNDAAGFGGHMWEELVDGFCSSLAAAGRAPGTIRQRRHYLRSLAYSAPDPLAVTQQALEAWMGSHDWVPATRKTARTSAIMFYRWLVSTGQLKESPANGLLPVSEPRAIPKPAPDAIYFEAIANAPYEVRIMLALARHAALRCVEVCKVRGNDLERGDMLRVVGKAGHQRLVPIRDPQLLAVLRSTPGYLFPGAVDGHLSAAWVSKQLGRALSGEWTAHKLRHAFGTKSYQADPDLLALADVMGHANVNTTRRYAGINDRQRISVVDAGAPGEVSLVPAAWQRPHAA
ncbi:tyrosine-type recombinase/integrase [Demequina sp. TTPB684]|uniref:tyrosine-type recombinase/integrase n=1 Tax=unclassified Demequina TaxID=2620311 RepID=UPI001CF50C15|nr:MULTISPECIES: tyrosine-type recombinase/integrase [unclassified Demequina]MCB2411776.1 tyrosine-type recombinase/integrase [Demequina sp. TTPB684]UPU89005.1 tyrosine-type recombinase/integrase [Demequina sp. TMPB413]